MISIIFAKWALSNSCFGDNPEDISNHRVLVKPKTPSALAKSIVVARQLLGIRPFVESLAAALDALAMPLKVFFGVSSSGWKIWSWIHFRSFQKIHPKLWEYLSQFDRIIEGKLKYILYKLYPHLPFEYDTLLFFTYFREIKILGLALIFWIGFDW